MSASTSLVIWIFAPELHGVLCKISDKQQRTFERSGADRSKSEAKKRGEQEADLATPAQLSTGRATSPATRGGAGWSRESPWPAQGHRGGGGWGAAHAGQPRRGLAAGGEVGGWEGGAEEGGGWRGSARGGVASRAGSGGGQATSGSANEAVANPGNPSGGGVCGQAVRNEKKDKPRGLEPWSQGAARRYAGGRRRPDTLNMSRRIWMSNERE